MKKSVLKQFIKAIIKEAIQKNIRPYTLVGIVDDELNVYSLKDYNDRYDHQASTFRKYRFDNPIGWRYNSKRNTLYWYKHNIPSDKQKVEVLEHIKSKYGIINPIQNISLEYFTHGHNVSESQDISNNQTYYQTNCTGISHGVSTHPRSVPSVRDELNDPRLNGKLSEQKNQDYKTKNFIVKFGLIKGIPYGEDVGKVFFTGKSANKGSVKINNQEYFCNTVFTPKGKGMNPRFEGKWMINQAQGLGD